MRAVDGEYLKSLAGKAPNPTRNIGRLAVPGTYKGIAEGGQARLAFRELAERPQRHPGVVSLAQLSQQG